MKKAKNNLSFLNIEKAIVFLDQLIETRLRTFFESKKAKKELAKIPFPKFKNDGSTFWEFIKGQKMTLEEVVVLVLALIPHLNPSFLNNQISSKLPKNNDFPEIGGVKSIDQRYFLPTGETVLFLLAGNNLTQKSRIQSLFSEEHFFAKRGILHLENVKSGTPKTTGKLILNEEYVDLFVLGKKNLPKLSMDFPATHLKTKLEWDDLVLPQRTLNEILEIKNWVEHSDTLMNDWGMAKKLKQGYRALFHGPSGTGKTMTATLLGNQTGMEVFRIDLSMVVSKFIGETEKNLSSLFDRAINKNWILFFDEADALFGKRTNVRDAHDKYANQEVSYLLQRIENHSGLIILASNFKGNMDAAFTRRFQSFILFSIPNAVDRLRIWQNAFPKKVKLEEIIDLMSIAEKFELSGSNIMNVVQFASLQALARKSNEIKNQDILTGIRKEFMKEGKLV